MTDAVGRVWDIILAVILMFFAPILLFSLKQDVTVQSYVDDAVHEFIDVSRAQGEITEAAYDRLIARLDATGNVYDIELLHYAAKQYPDGNGNYKTGYDAETTQAIVNDIYSDGYEMQTGDYIRCTIENISPTLSRRLMSLSFRSTTAGGQIYTTYGGYVGNDTQ